MQRVAAFSPSAILGVDWSSLPAYKAIAKGLIQRRLPVPPFVYMNYRCHTAEQQCGQQAKDAMQPCSWPAGTHLLVCMVWFDPSQDCCSILCASTVAAAVRT